MHRNCGGMAIAAGGMLAAHCAAAQGLWFISGSAGAVQPFDYSRPVIIRNGLGLHASATNISTYIAGEDVSPRGINRRWDSALTVNWAISVTGQNRCRR